MPSDIEIAQATTMDPVTAVAAGLGIPDEALEPYGHYKAKVANAYLDGLPERPDAKLILVTAISPT
ncbi:MAG: formate--tetrahydrofolate ligase, partial [Candidatus Nanopelagicales bacterium]